MTLLSADALDQVRHHTARLAKRIAAAGFRSSTLEAFRTQLDAAGRTASGDKVTRLQTYALQVERALRNADALSLADRDLPMIRYLLSGGRPTPFDPTANSVSVPKAFTEAADADEPASYADIMARVARHHEANQIVGY